MIFDWMMDVSVKKEKNHLSNNAAINRFPLINSLTAFYFEVFNGWFGLVWFS